MTNAVVFLDRASLKAKVRKPSFADEYIEHEKNRPAANRAAPRGRLRRHHEQSAPAGAIPARVARPQDDRRGGDRL